MVCVHTQFIFIWSVFSLPVNINPKELRVNDQQERMCVYTVHHTLVHTHTLCFLSSCAATMFNFLVVFFFSFLHHVLVST